MQLYKAFIKYFKALNQLQLMVFTCYLDQDYLLKKYFYEQKIHKARLKLMTAMQKVRGLANQNKQINVTKFEDLYEIIFSLNTLKLRITDPATFEMCEMELKKISECLSGALSHVIMFLDKQSGVTIKNSIENISDPVTHHLLDDTAKIMGRLSHQTDALEELYRSTLQVVLKEPIFFLFFVQDLIAFRDELESFLLELLNGKFIKN